MRLLRLRVSDCAAIVEADVEFGTGLNVLYGPNDLGKSTLADAIRLALLLPHTSSHIEDYIPWTGGQSPTIELTFEMEAQRIWRVTKQFRKGGTALLQESRNGVDFDDVERARKVDAKLREILRWGIPEPGGSGGSRGLPTSFLATALLSTQGDVDAVLSDSLQTDATGSGKERIAAALQAVAQDPLFQVVLNETQAWRDEAYTEKGAKKTARGSVFKTAADRVRELRIEKENLQKVVEDSEGVETQLRKITATRNQQEADVVEAATRVSSLEGLWTQAVNLAEAAQQVDLARTEVQRICQVDADIGAIESKRSELANAVQGAEQALKLAQGRHAELEGSLKSAEEAARASGLGSEASYTVARQALELRKIAAEQAASNAKTGIDSALAAQNLVDAADAAVREHRDRETEAERVRAAVVAVTDGQRSLSEQLRRLELLERALEVRLAEQRESDARGAVDRAAVLGIQLEFTRSERVKLMQLRTALVVPVAAALPAMRRLATELAAARGALNVGLAVTFTPRRAVHLTAKKDGATPFEGPLDSALQLEAETALDLDIADVGSLQIRGGRPDAQRMAQALEERWTREVSPHFIAANVADLDGLGAKVDEAQDLDIRIKAKEAELEALRNHLEPLSGATQSLHEASERLKICRDALGDVDATLMADLATLGSDPATELRVRRQRLASELESARETTNQAGTDKTLAEERARTAREALDFATQKRDDALTPFPQGLPTALSASRTSLDLASEELRTVTSELASLDRTIAAEKARIEGEVSGARAALNKARDEVGAAQLRLTQTSTEHAQNIGALEQLRKQRESFDLAAANARLEAATGRHSALPVPAEKVIESDLAEARSGELRLKADLERTVADIQRTQGALEQVGGAVARERLRDAIEALEVAERHEKDIEEEYEAWRLLLEKMKEADAAQASNLGQVLAPAIAGRFEQLTQKQYESVRLTAHLATDGVVVRGAVRPTERISVGTREQLSTLYRLCLAEYLQTTLVLDDQLVQSDERRMDWFRAMLSDKARTFQVVVFTCRQADYLGAGARMPKGKMVHVDHGHVRAIDLARAIRRR